MTKLAAVSLALSFVLSSCVSPYYQPPTSSGPTVRDVPRHVQGTDIEGPRQRMVVLPVIDRAESGHPVSLRTSLERYLLEELELSKQVVLVEPSELGVVLGEHKTSSGYNLTSLSEKAKAAGVGTLLEVVIEEIRVKRRADSVGILRSVDSEIEATVGVRVMDTRTKRIIVEKEKAANSQDSQVRFAKKRSTDKEVQHSPHQVEEMLQGLVFEFLPEIIASVQQQRWEGRIAMVKGGRLFLNVGRLSGLQMGDILKVSEKGDEVYDPENGALIGEVAGRMKGTLEVVGYFGKDGSVAVIHSGSGFEENDKVEFY